MFFLSSTAPSVRRSTRPAISTYSSGKAAFLAAGEAIQLIDHQKLYHLCMFDGRKRNKKVVMMVAIKREFACGCCEESR